MSILTCDSKNFHEIVLQSEIPVLVDFYADWCGPCKMMAPVLEELSQEFDGKIKIVKINVDNNPDLSSEYGVMSIPNMIIFENGKQKENIVGARSKQDLIKQLGI